MQDMVIDKGISKKDNGTNMTTHREPNSKILSKLFSRSVINRTIQDLDLRKIRAILKESGYSNIIETNYLHEMYNQAFDLLSKTYRNEYIYKTIIIEQILLGIHNLNTTVIVPEFKVGKSKADMAMFNGTSTVYEIKTELDSFERLDNQIQDYKKIFDQIYVVTSTNQVDSLLKKIDETVGILIVDNSNQILTYREPEPNKENVQVDVIFTTLRRYEYLNILKEEFDITLNIPNTEIYRKSLNIFKTISPVKAHDYMVGEIKKRGIKTKDFILNSPASLRTYALNAKLTKNEQSNFFKLLNLPIY